MMKTYLLAAILAFATAAAPLSHGAPSSREPAPGKDYIEIADGAPLDPAEGKVVIEEFFNYACPGCNNFEPVFAAWAAQLPPWAKVVHIPAAFRPDFVPYAKAYYAAEAMGVADRAHQAVYDAIHRTRQLPGEGSAIDENAIASFYANYGVNAAEFLAKMQSFAIDSRIRKATEHMRRCKIPSTPSLVISGRYLVQGKSYTDVLRVANVLIRREYERIAQ